MDRWRRLLDYARWAPSPHNIQPWRLQPLSETEAELLYVPDRLLPDTDPSSVFTISGLGIFVEHLAIAARAEGLDLDVELLATTLDVEADGAQSFARLHLAERPVEEPLPRELLRERRTSRLPYDGRPVPEGLLRELEQVAARSGHSFAFSNDPETVDWVVGLNCDTLFYDMEDRSRGTR